MALRSISLPGNFGLRALHLAWACCALIAWQVESHAAEDFSLRDGDTVVFLGDSITAARTYTKIIENYTLLRFPQRRIRFYNAGIGGDTAAGSLARLERDVFSRRPTVLTVCFGLNDIGWGLKADDEHKALYVNSLRTIIDKCQERKIRVFICSGPITAEDPDKGEAGYLQKMCDEAFVMAKAKGAGTIDVQRPMREIQRRVLKVNQGIADESKHTRLHLADGVHLNDLGHLAMAYAFLQGFNAPGDISQAEIDIPTKKVTAAGCRISDVRQLDDGCEFTRLDDGLPFNNGLFFALNFAYVPLHRDFNAYRLKITGLADGRYEVTVNGRSTAKFTAKQLAAGVDIASTTTSAWQPGGPWDAQATVLRSLTEARHEVDTARLLSRLYLADQPIVAELDRKSQPAEEQLIELQRLAARPRPYHFVIRPAAEAP
ncbi:GDSL-like Lipase/Acylhydrolase [Anatilimnocola aggregata]|uniref:GDSL-like Lipase/Acylhydrolase n=1 Tax=Anatilimnocola aggregata TaxID=2528021 RepID=A0A517YAE8_9BACT|nr:SGNH/GDSL hydrolase family protein [Anatilimnocola aggregata]QDU27171.1 GDSL-like Lipase/Acylhydrolase [Anatilimnocola aggregata]